MIMEEVKALVAENSEKFLQFSEQYESIIPYGLAVVAVGIVAFFARKK
jgi:hypothetical protein